MKSRVLAKNQLNGGIEVLTICTYFDDPDFEIDTLIDRSSIEYGDFDLIEYHRYSEGVRYHNIVVSALNKGWDAPRIQRIITWLDQPKRY